MSRAADIAARFWVRMGTGFLPFAEVATPELPLGRLLRLSLFQVSVGMAVVLVIGTLGFGVSILMEATLSFLGIGLPPTNPSLGTLIRTGNDYLFSGQWWIAVFPGTVLVIFVLAINLLGDWLRDALNPRLR